jgi:phage shock protein A
MCTLLTVTRARVHELLEDTEQQRDALAASLDVMRDRVAELSTMHDDARAEGAHARTELASMRSQLVKWSGAVERALVDLGRQAGDMGKSL